MLLCLTFEQRTDVMSNSREKLHDGDDLYPQSSSFWHSELLTDSISASGRATGFEPQLFSSDSSEKSTPLLNDPGTSFESTPSLNASLPGPEASVGTHLQPCITTTPAIPESFSNVENIPSFYQPLPKRRGRRPKNASQIPYKRTYKSRGRPRKSKSVSLAQSRNHPLLVPDSSIPLEDSSSVSILEDKQKRSFAVDDVFLKIIEQPQPKALRFRYICEGRSAGSIPGVNSTREHKSYPTVKLMNYQGPALVVVSCVTVDQPYRPHPHNLVGKDGCEGGVCSVKINKESMEYSFANLGIQCVKKRDIDKSLAKRQERGIDPYFTGFRHRNQTSSIDLNTVRLCFQVYLEDKRGKFSMAIQPTVSDPIYDKKATSELVINKLSDCSSPAEGGKEIIILCDKIAKEDIQILFFKLNTENKKEWEAFGEFEVSDVHKQVAISFKTPQYKDINITKAIKVFVQLHRPSDRSNSKPRTFFYYPTISDQSYLVKKIDERCITEKSLLELLETDLQSTSKQSADVASASKSSQQSLVAGILYQSSSYQSREYLSCSNTTSKSTTTVSSYENSTFDASFKCIKNSQEFVGTHDSQQTSYYYKGDELLDLDSQSFVRTSESESYADVNLMCPEDLSKSVKTTSSTDVWCDSSSKIDAPPFIQPEIDQVEQIHTPQHFNFPRSPERSVSPNSEVKKLKLDLEALNKLTKLSR